MPSSSTSNTKTSSSASASAASASRALQNGASGQPFNVGIIIAIIVGVVVVFAALIWLSNKQRGRWAAHEHRKEYEEADAEGSLPTYSDIVDGASSSSNKKKKQKKLLLPSRGAARDPMRFVVLNSPRALVHANLTQVYAFSPSFRAMEEGTLPMSAGARQALPPPPRTYNQAPGRVQPFQGL